MRRNILILTAVLLLASLPALSQALVPFYPSFPADLKQFLGLTDIQVAAITQITSDYTQTSATSQQRIVQLQVEIGDESRKEPLDPMAIGVRYAEIESIRRDLSRELSALRDKNVASLTDAQRAKLKMLDDARNLRALIGSAQCENLLDAGVTATFSPLPLRSDAGAVLSFGLSGCYTPIGATFPADLQQYLSLSSDQAAAIASLNGDSQQLTNLRQRRIAQLQAEIAQETAKDPIDPLALGTRYAEIESIRRDINTDLVTLRARDRAILNDMQRSKLGALDDLRKLQPLIGEAQCENLLDSPASSLVPPSLLSSVVIPVLSPLDRNIISVPAFSCGSPSSLFTP